MIPTTNIKYDNTNVTLLNLINKSSFKPIISDFRSYKLLRCFIADMNQHKTLGKQIKSKCCYIDRGPLKPRI